MDITDVDDEANRLLLKDDFEYPVIINNEVEYVHFTS